VDGHRSHMTQQSSQLCDENGVILISFFPNTTHIMQPADVAVFKPLKSEWKSAVNTCKFQNFPKEVTRYTFGAILKTVFDRFCCKYGHIASKYTSQEVCPICGENHNQNKCNSTLMKCNNCSQANKKLKTNLDTNHQVWSKDCTVLSRIIESQKKYHTI
jgi:hypothetical protein